MDATEKNQITHKARDEHGTGRKARECRYLIKTEARLGAGLVPGNGEVK